MDSITARHMYRLARDLIIGLLLAGALSAVPAIAASKEPPPAPARGLPDSQLSPLSLRLLEAGNSALGSSDLADAIRNYEAALAADPRNRQAYIGMARAAQADGLPGHAVRYYREALELDPNDLSALELQGVALVERGALPRAEDNLSRLRLLCSEDCPPAERLAVAISQREARNSKAKAPQAGKGDTGTSAEDAHMDTQADAPDSESGDRQNEDQ